jgi:hypothetical protein
VVWLILLVGAVAARVILAALRQGPQTSFTRALLFEFAVRRKQPGQVVSRRDRLWNGIAQLVTALTLLGLGALFITWADHYPNLSTTNHVLSGVGFIAAMVGVVISLAGIVEMARAPFAPKSPSTGEA